MALQLAGPIHSPERSSESVKRGSGAAEQRADARALLLCTWAPLQKRDKCWSSGSSAGRGAAGAEHLHRSSLSNSGAALCSAEAEVKAGNCLATSFVVRSARTDDFNRFMWLIKSKNTPKQRKHVLLSTSAQGTNAALAEWIHTIGHTQSCSPDPQPLLNTFSTYAVAYSTRKPVHTLAG